MTGYLKASPLQQRGMNVNPICTRCNFHGENTTHVLRDGFEAVRSRRQLGIPTSKIASLNLPLTEWMRVNCGGYEVVKHNLRWGEVFSQALWRIWRNWNLRAFEDSSTQKETARSCLTWTAEFFAMGIHGSTPVVSRTTRTEARWTPPEDGWVRLNMDGSVSGNPVLRDSQGIWVGGFSRHLVITNSLAAELWAIRDGLPSANSSGIQSLELEVDALAAFDLIWDIGSKNLKPMPHLIDCRRLFAGFHRRRRSCIFRAGNEVADKLANLWWDMEESFLCSVQPSGDMRDILFSDIIGISPQIHDAYMSSILSSSFTRCELEGTFIFTSSYNIKSFNIYKI